LAIKDNMLEMALAVVLNPDES